jgi:hypothetical protein
MLFIKILHIWQYILWNIGIRFKKSYSSNEGFEGVGKFGVIFNILTLENAAIALLNCALTIC